MGCLDRHGKTVHAYDRRDWIEATATLRVLQVELEGF
jgi:hypothetical protein